MSKKVKVLVSVLVAVVLLTVGGTAVVMAQGEEPAPSPEANRQMLMVTANTTALLARVAQILGITEDELGNAFQQARQEMRGEAFLRWLDKAVEEGLITTEEYDEIVAWWEERPEAFGPGLFRHSFDSPALGGPKMWGGQRGLFSDDANYRLRRAFADPASGERRMWGSHRGWQGLRIQQRLAD